MSIFSTTIQTSADPVFQHQALSIAEAYMEEILLKDFAIVNYRNRNRVIVQSCNQIIGLVSCTDIGQPIVVPNIVETGPRRFGADGKILE